MPGKNDPAERETPSNQEGIESSGEEASDRN